MLAKLSWRRVRCAACQRPFTLPLDDVTLPTHPRSRGGTEPCPGGDAVPA